MPCSTIQVADGHVEVVEAFVYLGSMIDSSGGSIGEVMRRIGIAGSCMNLLEKESRSQASGWIPKYASTNIKAKFMTRQKIIQYLPISLSCCMVQNMVHHKAPVLLHWCIWHVGTMQDPEDTIYSPCDECGSQSNHRMPSSLPPGHWQTFAALQTYCPQLTTRWPPVCCRCSDLEAASQLEATVGKN